MNTLSTSRFVIRTFFVAALAAVLMLVACGPEKHDPPLPGAEERAEQFGGDPGYWRPVPDSSGTGWVYEGPETVLTIQADYRIDYPHASCAEDNRGGVYGPHSVRVGHATVWYVPNEKRCPNS